MLSRWTDFLTTDEEKSWRQRDLEFEEVIKSKDEILLKWNEGWSCLFKAIDGINEQNINSIVYIRNQGHSVIEALNRQMAHYAYHIGQIVYLGKLLKSDSWVSLSIAKGKSSSYNEERFSRPKSKSHFTDEHLDSKRDK